MPDSIIADVFITSELATRAPRKTDYLQEKLALQELSAQMIDHPDQVLPRFVDLAMEMCGGISAGLSLYEERPTPGVFRWHYLRGSLAAFNGATTPRNFSPCGITLDQNTPVLTQRPERVYTWLVEAEVSLPEVLLVPLYLGTGIPLGTLWIVSEKEGHFDSGHARVLTEMASFVGIALRMLRTEQSLQIALEEQETLTKEMDHRVKNLFAMTEGLLRISARGTTSKEEMTTVMAGRLHALSAAHALVRRNFSEADTSPATDLASLLDALLRPYQPTANGSAQRIAINGPTINCGERAMHGLALVFHEFVTNAAKYGALKNEEGQIDISWQQDGENLVIRWIESGGPEIDAPPLRTGFGSTLAQSTVIKQFGGIFLLEWQSSGLSITVTVPVDRLLNFSEK